MLKRWPEAEPSIVKAPLQAYLYAEGVIKGRWPEAEPGIAKVAAYAYGYALDVIQGRWPEAEPVIMDSIYKNLYLQLLQSKGITI
jgi:hypothetical protein